MTKILIAALVATVATPVLAADPAAYSFKRDGMTYNVSQKDFGNYSLIEGTDSRGRAFNFRVEGRNVEGIYGGDPVSFKLDRPLSGNSLAMR